jgi:Transcriptional regulatory protein, C terminal/Bacterial transcriptional activator domain
MLEIRVLGPIEVLRDGRPVPLGGARQRALVADLALHANEVVSAERLIDDLWGDEPPDTAAHMLHVYVSRLRKTLEDHGRAVLETRPPGYVLNLEPQDDLDAARFEAHVRRGRDALDSRPAEALATFDEALAWWRGRALEEFAHEPFALPAAARLEESVRQPTRAGLRRCLRWAATTKLSWSSKPSSLGSRYESASASCRCWPCIGPGAKVMLFKRSRQRGGRSPRSSAWIRAPGSRRSSKRSCRTTHRSPLRHGRFDQMPLRRSSQRPYRGRHGDVDGLRRSPRSPPSQSRRSSYS